MGDGKHTLTVPIELTPCGDRILAGVVGVPEVTGVLGLPPAQPSKTVSERGGGNLGKRQAGKMRRGRDRARETDPETERNKDGNRERKVEEVR